MGAQEPYSSEVGHCPVVGSWDTGAQEPYKEASSTEAWQLRSSGTSALLLPCFFASFLLFSASFLLDFFRQEGITMKEIYWLVQIVEVQIQA